MILSSIHLSTVQHDPSASLSTIPHFVESIQVQDQHVTTLGKYMVYHFGFTKVVLCFLEKLFIFDEMTPSNRSTIASDWDTFFMIVVVAFHRDNWIKTTRPFTLYNNVDDSKQLRSIKIKSLEWDWKHTSLSWWMTLSLNRITIDASTSSYVSNSSFLEIGLSAIHGIIDETRTIMFWCW